jgi:hypothetical protein
MMPLLPPCGIFFPTTMIFNHQLPPSVQFTWIQLFCQAWNGRSTPPLSIQQLVQITGRNQVTLFRHLSRLQSTSALRWHSNRDGRIIISFHDNLSEKSEPSVGFPSLIDSNAANSNNRDISQPAHYFPPRILGYLSYQDDQIE